MQGNARLADRVAIITGAGSGIGAAAASLLNNAAIYGDYQPQDTRF
jgi:NAD(P)-dependent dehydrogenase (short-subunit alcohol dehydrogenase family)